MNIDKQLLIDLRRFITSTASRHGDTDFGLLDRIERMAREIHAACTHPPQQQARAMVTDEIVESARLRYNGRACVNCEKSALRAALELVADQLSSTNQFAGGGK